VRLAVVASVIQEWRYPLWLAVAGTPGLECRFFHGASIPSAKQVNARDLSALPHLEFKTVGIGVQSSGRDAALKYHVGVAPALEAFKPDIVLCEGGSNVLTNVVVFRWAARRGVPVIWWGLGELKGRRYQGFVSRVYRQLRLSQERRSSSYLGYSSVAREYFLSQGYPEERCYVALNCLNTDRIAECIPADRAALPRLRKELGVSVENQVILFCGSVIEAKRLDRLIIAFAMIAERYPKAILVVVGDGPALQAAKELASRLRIAGQVVFVGAVWTGAGAFFELARFFVLPGLGGLAICESMTHGIPVISAPADGTEVDYIQPGKTGFLLQQDDEEKMRAQLAQYMSFLLDNCEDAREMGTTARKFVERHACSRVYVDSLMKCVRETLARPVRW
jgi:glycosyltransferase involved in cell wall biosynthesis